ncbi:MAG: alcohol dehydrogenase [Myxococcales bacterium]|nr:alcohol dehydrogenase [Myxococcales bacterium]
MTRLSLHALGPNVTPWKVGQRVGVGWHGGHDFVCEQFRRGLFINCVNAKITGISHDGGYAEYVVVPAESVARIPEGLAAIDAGPLMCAGVTTYNSLRNSGARRRHSGSARHRWARTSGDPVRVAHGISDGRDLARRRQSAARTRAHEYIDTQSVPAAEALQKLGGADLVLATAPNSEAIASTAGGLKPRGKLLIVAAPFEPLSVSAFGLLSGKSVAGWPSGSAIDSEDAMAFSALTAVKPRVETFKLEQAELALAKMLENRVRFRAVLVP